MTKIEPDPLTRPESGRAFPFATDCPSVREIARIDFGPRRRNVVEVVDLWGSLNIRAYCGDGCTSDDLRAVATMLADAADSLDELPIRTPDMTDAQILDHAWNFLLFQSPELAARNIHELLRRRRAR